MMEGTSSSLQLAYLRRTALHLACANGRLEAVKLLIQTGANINVMDRWGRTPLDDAIHGTVQLTHSADLNVGENTHVVEYLTAEGAKRNTTLPTATATHSPNHRELMGTQTWV